MGFIRKNAKKPVPRTRGDSKTIAESINALNIWDLIASFELRPRKSQAHPKTLRTSKPGFTCRTAMKVCAARGVL